MPSLPLVRLENFEGPFDLLIELARDQQIDLSNISIGELTDSFFTYLEQVEIPASLKADFTVVASTLLLLKLRQLLPTLLPEEETEIASLTDRLRIYQYYREQAIGIKQQWGITPLLPGPVKLSTAASHVYPDLTTAYLEVVMQNCLDRIRRPLNKTRHLRPRGKTLQECLTLVTDRLAKLNAMIFQQEFKDEEPRTTAVSFLAVLELARQQHVDLQQTAPLEQLHIRRK
ncbi:MAG: segregation/condensation protein A [Candidatus Andersenbacteria bacterium]